LYNVERLVIMEQKKKKNIDFKIAETIEIITRKSTETENPGHAIRSYASYLHMGERNLYKMIDRAYHLGFRFGVSVNYDRVGLSRLLAVVDGELDLPLPVEAVYRTLDGRRIYDLLVPFHCLRRITGLVRAHGGQAYTVSIEWGSRPALASLRFFNIPEENGDVEPHVVEGFRRVFQEVLALGPPRNIMGRRYRLDRILLALIAAARREIIVKSIADIARELGISQNKAQRKYYNAWRRRIILGYSVVDAPYFRPGKVMVEVFSNDPVRMAYAAAVLPPVVSGLVVNGHTGRPDRLLLVLSGPMRLLSSVVSLIKDYQGNIGKITCYYDEWRNPDYPREIVSLSEQALLC